MTISGLLIEQQQTFEQCNREKTDTNPTSETPQDKPSMQLNQTS